MALELAGISLDKLTDIEVFERARVVSHEIPGFEGNLSQVTGRPSVVVRFKGIFYGTDAGDALKSLRDTYLAGDPVDFFAEAVGQGYFAQVIISQLQVIQRAGYDNQYDYSCEVMEYIEPPQPSIGNILGDIDLSLLDEVTGLMDDIQNAMDMVSQLSNLLGNIPSFGDPTTRLPAMLDSVSGAVGGGTSLLSDTAGLF